jgi:hypothetical protein
VTNRQFEAYEPEHRRSESSSGDDDPVTQVTLEQARAYCAWYAGVSRKPMRLPTEPEWEYACAGAESFGLHGLDPHGIAEWIDDDRGIVRRSREPTREFTDAKTLRDDLGFRLVRSFRMK